MESFSLLSISLLDRLTIQHVYEYTFLVNITRLYPSLTDYIVILFRRFSIPLASFCQRRARVCDVYLARTTWSIVKRTLCVRARELNVFCPSQLYSLHLERNPLFVSFMLLPITCESAKRVNVFLIRVVIALLKLELRDETR